MEPRVDQRSVITTIRSIVDDKVVFTSSELTREFTLAAVARSLATSRRAVRRVFNTVEEAAIGVRLQKLDEAFTGWSGTEQVGRSPSERFHKFCDFLADYGMYHFFVDAKPVFRVFEEKGCAEFVAIASDGLTHGVFNMPDVVKAAQFAFDVMRLLAIQAHFEDEEIQSLPTDGGPERWSSTYENHLDLVLRSWGWNLRH